MWEWPAAGGEGVREASWRKLVFELDLKEWVRIYWKCDLF